MIKILRQSFASLFIYGLVLLLSSSVVLEPVWGQARRGLFIQDSLESAKSTQALGGSAPAESNPYSANSSAAPVYQVHVLGEVKTPGIYRISASMRVTDALQAAGGVNKNGSERFIELRKLGQRQGKTIDLFSYSILGDLSQNPYLQDNDTLYIPLKQRVVEIEGPIRRPGVYELKNEKDLQDIIDLAGGFTVGVSEKDAIRVVRYQGNDEKQVFEINKNSSDAKNFILQDGDVVIIPHKFLTKNTFDYNLKTLPNDNIFYPAQENKVFVIGAVRLPGPFEFNPHYALRQYLTLAGGTTTMAKNKKIQVVRADGHSLKARDKTFDGIINPGDTIVVPEKSIPDSYYISLMTTIASMGLSAVAIFK